MEETLTEVPHNTPLVASNYPDHLDKNDQPRVLKWEIDVHEGDDGMTTEVITGRLLGFSSGQEDKHTKHPGEWAPQKFKCAACRWVDVSIYDIGPDPAARARHRNGVYLIHTVGRSDLPHEKDFVRIAPARNAPHAFEMVHTRQGGNATLSVPSGQAFAEASQYDEKLRAVWKDHLDRQAQYQAQNGHHGHTG